LLAGLTEPSMNARERGYWLWVGLGGMVMFVADVVALYWMGMWLGMAAKNPKHAFGAAIAPILTLPGIAVALVMTAISLLPYELRRGFHLETLPFWLWFGFSLAADFFFGQYARHKLLTEFREVATQRYQPKPSWWQRLTGKGEGREFS
jgi:hypothetical protein